MARLGRPHGLDGYLGLYVDPENLVYFGVGLTVRVGGKPLVVRGLRRADRGHQVAFEGVEDRPAAEELRGLEVSVTERRHLGPGEFWPEDLVGLEVRDQNGERLGGVSGVITGSAQDRLVVDGDGSVFEIPFVDDLVPVVDPEAGYLQVIPIPGLTEPSD